MRIAFGFDIFYPESNGVITTTINLANNLIEMGHEVYFFVPADRGFRETTIEKGIHIIRVKALPSFIYKGIKLLPIQSWYLRKYFMKYKFDVIHDTSPWLICQAMNHAARKMHIPVLATHHTLIDNPIYIKYALKSRTLAEAAQKPIWSIVFAPFFRLVWMVTAPNKETCESLKQHVAGIDVRYVSNGIDIDQFRKEDVYHPIAQIPKEWVNHNTFLFVGRLGFEKAIDVTLEGFAKACAQRPDGPGRPGAADAGRRCGKPLGTSSGQGHHRRLPRACRAGNVPHAARSRRGGRDNGAPPAGRHNGAAGGCGHLS